MSAEAKNLVRASVYLPTGVVVETNVGATVAGGISSLFDSFFGDGRKSSLQRDESSLPVKLTLEVPRDSVKATSKALRELSEALLRATEQ